MNGKAMKSPRLVWTMEMDAILHVLYSNALAKDIAQKLGCSVLQVYRRADRLGLKKSEGFLSSAISGQFQRGERRAPETMFKPGNKPWSAGKKIGTHGRTGETQFKPGERPINWVSIGTTKINREGYQLIKVSNEGSQWERWKFLHRLTWEFHNGAIPEKHVIVFRDGNRLNCQIKNLECVSREEAAKYKLMYPLDLRQLIALRGAITRQINKRIKNEEANSLGSA